MPVAYRFPTGAPKARKVEGPAKVEQSADTKAVNAERQPFGSSLEAWCYQALLELGWPKEDIEVQTPVLGGRRMKGGQVVDIVLYKPMSCAISLKGAYFHGNQEEEFLSDVALSGEFNEYVIIWDYEAPNYAAMLAICEKRVGRP